MLKRLSSCMFENRSRMNSSHRHFDKVCSHRQLLERFKLYRLDKSGPYVAALFYWLKIGGGCGIIVIAKGALGRTLPTAAPFAICDYTRRPYAKSKD